jgi:hypothetical protein
MKSLTAVLSIAVIFSLAPVAVAQHGRAGGGSGGHAMGHTRPTHGASATHEHAAQTKSVSDRLARNTKLSSNLEKLLPTGMTAQQACTGFKNLGQCVAAVHVSHNLGIPFADLKTKMLGAPASGNTPATAPMSLGKAIQTLKPNADAKAETKKASTQAKEYLKDS